MATDAESALVMDLPRSPALEPGGLEENPSPPPSALMSQASDLIPSPTTGLMNRPAAGTNLSEPSAIGDDEERVDYEGSSTGDAADEDRDDDEDADVGNMPGDDAGDDEHNSMDDITLFDDVPKVPSDKASGYTPFHISGSPPTKTTAATTSEQDPVQVSAPPQEQHLPGSPTSAASPVAPPETIVTTPPLEQPVVQVSAPVQEQPLPISSTAATSSTALMKISLTPAEARPSTSQARAMMALTSSPSQLNVSTASAASAPGSPAPISMALGASSSITSSLSGAPEFLQISLVYLNSLAKKHFEVLGRRELQPQIVSTLASLQVVEVARREAIERDLAERKRQITEIRERNIRKREELERSTTSMNSLRDRLVEAEAEVLRLKAKLAREENVVNILSTQNATGALEYHTQARALEQARNEAAAIITPSEEELRAKAEALVRTTHEEELTEVRTQLVSFDLMHE
ncbi:uncharacterized protein LOC109828211 [Asparagus officinalis]|uniref:uncharacterized protein LOC109828211 n=1 Tax=Asparagus officinalis TaxID=4686 RepID=UPI00098E0928|nr:uncharacterized protein LOC109828211 [Asparagus officinalis]